MSTQVAQDLRAAAEVLRRDGWAQGSFHKGCHHCVQGAIAVAVSRGKAPNPDRWVWNSPRQIRFDSANQTLALFLQDRFGNFVMTHHYNDAPGRTADEVIAALEAAADAAERKAAYDEGRWCGECQYGVVNDPPCCTQEATQ